MPQRHTPPALLPAALELRQPAAARPRVAPTTAPQRVPQAWRAWRRTLWACAALAGSWGALGTASLAQAEPAPASASASAHPAAHTPTDTTATAAVRQAETGPQPAAADLPGLPTPLAEPARMPLDAAAATSPAATAARAEPSAAAVAAASAKTTAATAAEASSLSDKGLQVKALAQGVVSYYADYFSGRSTANGERFDQRAMTMAHRSLPFGTLVRVVCLRTERSVVVRVNDRGPFIQGRVADLSRAAAAQLNMLSAGLTQARLEVLGPAAGVKAPVRGRVATRAPASAAQRR